MMSINAQIGLTWAVPTKCFGFDDAAKRQDESHAGSNAVSRGRREGCDLMQSGGKAWRVDYSYILWYIHTFFSIDHRFAK